MGGTGNGKMVPGKNIAVASENLDRRSSFFINDSPDMSPSTFVSTKLVSGIKRVVE